MILEITAGIVLGGVILFILWTFQKELVSVIGYGLLALFSLALFVPLVASVDNFQDISYLVGAIFIALFVWGICIEIAENGRNILKDKRELILSKTGIRSEKLNKFLDSIIDKKENSLESAYRIPILVIIGMIYPLGAIIHPFSLGMLWAGVGVVLFLSATMLGVLASDLMQGKEITPRLYLVSMASGAILFTAYAVWHKFRKNRPVPIPKKIVESQDRYSFNVIRYFVHQLASDQHDPSCEIFLNTFLFDDYLEKFKKAVDYFANNSKFSTDCVELIVDLQELIIKCEEYITAGKASESNYNEEWFGKTTLVEAIGDITGINDEIMKFQNLLAANE